MDNLAKTLQECKKELALKDEKIAKLQKALNEKNNTNYQEKKPLEQDELIKIHTRQALMGEMIEMILHQWRQPLSTFALATSTLQLFKETGDLNDAIFEKYTDIMMNNVYFLNETISIFRDFFDNKQEIKKTKPSVIMHKIFILISPIIKQYNDIFSIEFKNDIWFTIDENELIQVLLNIFKNSMDEFNKKKTPNPSIQVRFILENKYINIEIEDNAGGIENSIIDKIFDKKFTTKHTSMGTGLGLYISKDIIEKNLNGEIFALNGTYGAIFKLKIPIS